MGSGQSKPADDDKHVHLAQDERPLYKHNKLSSGKPSYKFKPMSLRVRNGLRTSSQSDTSPGCADDSPTRINTIFRKSSSGNKRRGYNSFKEPVNRKYPWRGGNENEPCISLLPKKHSLKPWGPIKNYYQTDSISNYEKQMLKARDMQSRFCREIHEHYASMGETGKRRRLEAIQALEKQLQHKSGFAVQNIDNKCVSLRNKDLKSQISSDSSVMGVPKSTNKPIINSEIHAWRVEHFSNDERLRASIVNKTSKTKVISDRINKGDVKDKKTDLCNVAYETTESTESEICPRLNFKKTTSATYINKIYNNSRLNTLVTNGRNCKMWSRFGKDMMYPRQTNKAVFLLLKTFANRSPSPVKSRQPKIGRAAPSLCDRSTSVSMENFHFRYKSVETQTLPVHISRKLDLDSDVLAKLDRVPKLEVDHRGSLTKHVSRTPSTRTVSGTQQIVLGYRHGFIFETRKRDDAYVRRQAGNISDTSSVNNKLAGRRKAADNIHQINANSDIESIDDRPYNTKFNTRRDNFRQTDTVSEKCASNTWPINKKINARRIAAANIHQRIANSGKESIVSGPNIAKFNIRRTAPDNGPQMVISHEKEFTVGQSKSDRCATRTVPNNTAREKTQNGSFSPEMHNNVCYNGKDRNIAECQRCSAQKERDYAKQRYEEERLGSPEHTCETPRTADTCTYQRTDAAKEEYYRSQQKRCRIPVPTGHRNDYKGNSPSFGKRTVQMEDDSATDKDKFLTNSEDYKNLCKLRLDLVNAGGDRNVPSVRRESRGSPDEDGEDIDRLLCGRRKTCRHWGRCSAPRCDVCLERVCYDIKEDEEDSDSSQIMS